MTVISASRVFDFETDTFAYPNELVWEYHFDPATGRGWTEKRMPPPTYALHCFVVARSARQFFRNVEFQPEAVTISDADYTERIKTVARSNPRETGNEATRIKIPGFANLRDFSQAHPQLLKSGCGGAWQSYVQRGNWRMVLPFTRSGQRAEAAKLSEGVAGGRLPMVHVATFPSLTINHVLLLFGSSEGKDGWEFQAYDPNICDGPITLRFDAKGGWFEFPRTHYFAGGRVNVYEIYRGMFF